MSKVTSKLQVTIPKAIAEQYGIRTGAELDRVAVGDSIKAVPRAPKSQGAPAADVQERVKWF